MEILVRLLSCFIVSFAFLFSYDLEASVELQPHRAYYTVTMDSRPDPRSSVTDARGTMVIEFEKVCGGWTLQQRSETRMYHNDGTVEHIRWGYVTFEAEDGSLFTFNTYRKNNDELVEDIRGKAEKKGNNIIVTYQKPEKKTLKLPEGVLFPTQHVKTLLRAAEGEEQIFPHVVFDGSSEEGASEINAFVGAQKVVEADPANKAAHQFANQPFWPVRFAVYGPEATEYDPIYVTTQDLLPNGIIKQYVIDYGGVKIHGVLERLELLRDGGC